MKFSPREAQTYFEEVLKAEVFGAFTLALDARRSENHLSKTELSKRLCKDKTRTSKLLAEPGNWTIRTISQFALALDVVVDISLRDRTNPARVFTASGIFLNSDWQSENQVQSVGPTIMPVSERKFATIESLNKVFEHLNEPKPSLISRAKG